MLFRRRKPADLWERARTMVWPRRSFWRSAQYFVKRALRLTATPHAIAAGIAAGVFASFTPFMGFHFFIAAGLAWCIGGNLVASAIGTAVGNPLTFPFIWGATLETGRLILYGRELSHGAPIHLGKMLRHLEFSQLWEPVIKPMSVGALPLGIFFALVFYFVTRWATFTFREQRRKRLAERARRKAGRQAFDARTATSS
ncbi:DUF2062 domain-containing protein [Nitratireductor sp. L1-7-SE]|uniref:DUF2062 domain-containing protein n=1 Tax=Nitratireductor rhodophyticola TaxID=2854036 RepID=A0ABS7RCI2_9HYPH|nr:DUF2062 domain-containing protein [Nitratireductor rhodophyticola]MBY8920185.1 DUF2062 domain-containing protein [Nitratireductor rhodophyticola]